MSKHGFQGRPRKSIVGNNGATENVTLNLSKRDLRIIEYHIHNGEAKNRSEFMRRALAFYLDKLDQDAPLKQQKLLFIEEIDSKIVRRLENYNTSKKPMQNGNII